MSFTRFSDALKLGRDGAISINGLDNKTRGKDYILESNVIAAVDIAMGLGRPLLISGDPGVGKTELGFAIARRMGFPRTYHFVTKSTTEARDLFYRYDALGRFRDAHAGTGAPPAGNYIEYHALGAAILDAHPKALVSHLLVGERAYAHSGDPVETLVVIDEVDKASRDFPNDILVELESLQFSVAELPASQTEGGKRQTPQTPPIGAIRPFVVIISNEERQLPDTFLRRCVFHQIEFPGENVLQQIIASKVWGPARAGGGGPAAGGAEGPAPEAPAPAAPTPAAPTPAASGPVIATQDMAALLRLNDAIRKKPEMVKKPGVSEMIDAALILVGMADRPDRLMQAVTALAKLRGDRGVAQAILKTQQGG